MGLREKFLDQIQTAWSIPELESIGEDLGRARGLSEEESEAIGDALSDAFDRAVSLDTTIDDNPQVVRELQAEAKEKRALEVRASASLTGMPMELS